MPRDLAVGIEKLGLKKEPLFRCLYVTGLPRVHLVPTMSTRAWLSTHDSVAAGGRCSAVDDSPATSLDVFLLPDGQGGLMHMVDEGFPGTNGEGALFISRVDAEELTAKAARGVGGMSWEALLTRLPECQHEMLFSTEHVGNRQGGYAHICSGGSCLEHCLHASRGGFILNVIWNRVALLWCSGSSCSSRYGNFLLCVSR
jgi:hypothetical protein